MPPKKNKGKHAGKDGGSKKSPALHKGPAVCSAQGPGPKYKLKNLVGYDDHCTSRFRGPAYSLAARQTGQMGCDGPGPIYYPQLPRSLGFSIGSSQRGGTIECGPGPYLLPDAPRGPAFSLRSRTKVRGGATSAGPYNLPSGWNGPAFTIAGKPPSGLNEGGPGPGPPYSVDPIKPRAPAFSLRARQNDSGVCASPGPGNPYQPDKSPAFSFGIKHNPCNPPFVTECDEVC